MIDVTVPAYADITQAAKCGANAPLAKTGKLATGICQEHKKDLLKRLAMGEQQFFSENKTMQSRSNNQERVRRKLTSEEIADLSRRVDLIFMALTGIGLIQWSRSEHPEAPSLMAELDLEIRQGKNGYELVLYAFPDEPFIQRDPAGGAFLSVPGEMAFPASIKLCTEAEMSCRDQEKRTA